jgi:hypothetical protein
MTPTKDQALQPVWGIIAHRQEIGQPFAMQGNKPDHLHLPTSTWTSIANWLRSDPAKLPKKLSPKVSTALVDTAMPTPSCMSCRCSPPCSTLSYPGRREQGYKTKRGCRRSSSTTGAPISAQLFLTAKRLSRRRREEQEEGPGKRCGRACVASFVSLRFSLVSGFSVFRSCPLP